MAFLGNVAQISIGRIVARLFGSDPPSGHARSAEAYEGQSLPYGQRSGFGMTKLIQKYAFEARL